MSDQPMEAPPVDTTTVKATEHDPTYQNAIINPDGHGSDMDEGEGHGESEVSESDYDPDEKPQDSKWKRDAKHDDKKRDEKCEVATPLPDMETTNHINMEEVKYEPDNGSTVFLGP